MRPREVFLSHASADRRAAERIVSCLGLHGTKVWYSKSKLRGSQAWQDEIGKALGRCDWLIVLLTPAAVRSDWVKHELAYSLAKKRYRRRIIPALLKDCRHQNLSFTLAAMQMVDFRKSFRSGLTDLLRVWNIRLKPKAGKA